MAADSIRVAILFEYPTLNGGERSMLAVVDRVDRGQIEFVAIAPPSGRLADALSQRGVEHIPFVLRDDSGTKLPRETLRECLLAAVNQAAPEMLHANSLSMGRLTGAIADELSIPTIAHIRDILKLSGAAIADLNRNQLLIAVSNATRDFHIEQGLSPAQTRVLYNGVDCEEFQPRPATGRLKRELGLGEDISLAATIGQIGLRKGQDVLAAAAVLTRNACPDLHYLLVGERHSSKRESIEFEQRVIDRFRQAGIGDRLHRLGYRTDIPWIMNEADLLIHPAHQEPLGRVLLEAAASGLPIIATDVGGTKEIVKDGQSARLVGANDSVGLAAAIEELHTHRSLRDSRAVNALECMKLTFNSALAADNLCREWKTLAGR